MRLGILGFSLWLVGCGTAPVRVFKSSEWALVPQTEQRGVASWYGRGFQGHRTASGEIYNQWDYTAAHRTLPFGTVIRIKNLRSQETVLVEITDRGPFVKNRLVDVSRRAAEEIGLIGPGSAPVEIQIARRRE